MTVIKKHFVLRSYALSLIASLLVIGISSNAFAITKKDLRRVDERGSVEVVAVYLSPLQKGGSQELVFEVTLDTHSADLSQYNLKELSVVRIDGGPEVKASEVGNPGGGGHHISGAITFNTSLSPSAESLELIVKNVGDVKERIFKWTLPLN